jgi:hypothetical protein
MRSASAPDTAIQKDGQPAPSQPEQPKHLQIESDFPQPIDRRSGSRHEASLPASLETPQGRMRSALVRDLSTSGVLLLTRAKLEVGDAVGVYLHLEGEGPPFVVRGKVVRESRRGIELVHPWTSTLAVHFDVAAPEPEPAAKELAARRAKLLRTRKQKK